MVFAGAMCVLAGHHLMQPKSLPAHCGGQKYQQESSLCFNLHEVCLKSLTRVAGGYFKSQSLDAKPAFGYEVTKECRGQITARYSHSHRSTFHPLTPAAKVPFLRTGLLWSMCLRNQRLQLRR
jgi:hypothetical protein